MRPANSHLLAINGGSSSIKVGVFESSKGVAARRIGRAVVDGIGKNATLRIEADGASEESSIETSDYGAAARKLAGEIRRHLPACSWQVISHRIVHGGLKLKEHSLLTSDVIDELKNAIPFDLAHLPRELALVEAFAEQFPGVPQVACLDTAFFAELPSLATLLPIPREYREIGMRRIGFHGLSYTFLMSELRRLASTEAAGRVVLAHLGSGASMAAIRGGKPIDTSMCFTPTAGLVMGTRPGDLDPGMLVQLMRASNLSYDDADKLLNQNCGLLALAEVTADVRQLLANRESDHRAAEAIALFCYQAKKFIGAYTAALGGLDAIVFSGGIGENAPQIRSEICEGLDFLGVRIDNAANERSDTVISRANDVVKVWVIPTNEERVMIEIAQGLIADRDSRPL